MLEPFNVTDSPLYQVVEDFYQAFRTQVMSNADLA